MRLLVLVSLSVVLMVMDHKYKNLESVRDALSLLVYPIQLAVDLPGSVTDWFNESLATRRHLQEEIDSLRTQQFVQQAQMQKFAALQAENIRLRELLDSSFEVGEKVLIAELMSVNLDPYKHQVVINKGELHDIYPGQPLVDATGVMGQIVHAGPYSSTAMLITDTSHAIPIQVNRNGLRSIALGSGTINRLELPYIPNSADIQPGDLLITSGLGGRFPPGYPVATVTAVQHDPGNAFSSVVATPLAHLNRSREVLLIWPSQTTVIEATENIPVEALDDTTEPEGTAETAAATAGNESSQTGQIDSPNTAVETE
jgi:rod shape-determining protein MreC